MDTIDDFFAMMNDGMSEEDELREIVRQTAFYPLADEHYQRQYREHRNPAPMARKKVRAVRKFPKSQEAIAARIKVNEAYARMK